jgi:hypothetical protein
MTDYVDWQEWMDRALFDAMFALRDLDWSMNPMARKILVDRLARIQNVASSLNTYAPKLSED